MILRKFRKNWWEFWNLSSHYNVFSDDQARKILIHLIFKNPYRFFETPYGHSVFDTPFGRFTFNCLPTKLTWYYEPLSDQWWHAATAIQATLDDETLSCGDYLFECVKSGKGLIPSGKSFVNLRFKSGKPLNDIVFLADLGSPNKEDLKLHVNYGKEWAKINTNF